MRLIKSFKKDFSRIESFWGLVNSEGKFYQELTDYGVQVTEDPEQAFIWRSSERAQNHLREYTGFATSDRLKGFSVCEINLATKRDFVINVYENKES